MHTDNRFETYWNQARDFIRNEWPQFTDVELNRVNGNYDLFLHYLKEFYHDFPLQEAVARGKLQKLFNTLDDKLFTSKQFL